MTTDKLERSNIAYGGVNLPEFLPEARRRARNQGATTAAAVAIAASAQSTAFEIGSIVPSISIA